MTAYYNEIDPYAAQWLRNLIAAGHIAPGDVDERSIVDVHADDIRGYTQCHFFAGIGVWSYALRNAGWSDSRSVWTGSCPCQPFSAAGKALGHEDERHLWPTWFGLIGECGPGVVFGEQVASADGLAWLDVVQTDMEAKAYTVGAVDTCAAGFGAPHIRQRLFFVADTEDSDRRCRERGAQAGVGADDIGRRGLAGSGAAGELGNAAERGQRMCGRASGEAGRPALAVEARVMDNTECARLERHGRHGDGAQGRPQQAGPGFAPSALGGFWRDADWLYCRDEKYRPVESGTFPLASRIANRVGRLRAYGNSIVAPVAQEFIEAYEGRNMTPLNGGDR